MHFRPPDEQNNHKVTCGVHASVVDQVQDRIRDSLKREGAQAKFILSGKGDWRFLDIVSTNAGKLQALEFVRQKHGFDHEHTVACGDSGNDKDMLGGQNRAIVVGNAQPDLVQWVHDTQQQHSSGNGAGPPRLLFTQQHMAAGILEGLESFGLK
jgi:hydroxymethylpyrimidine pyrophosphatase-like HAD family hydrolase